MRNTFVLNAIGELLLSNKSKIKYFLGLMLCVSGIGFTATAAPTDLDPTFGNGGKVYSDVSITGNRYFLSMALQPDGKIVTVGSENSATPTLPGFIVMRYNADGSADTTFGNNGTVLSYFTNNRDYATGIAVQSDGKIVVGGHYGSYPAHDLAVRRFNTDGSIDTAFGANGITTIGFTNSSGNYDDYFGAIKIAPDGKIVVGGSAAFSEFDNHASLARLNTDGSFDTTFGNNGKMLSGGYKCNDLAILPDGSIGITGDTLSDQFTTIGMFAARHNPNGSMAWSYYSPGSGAPTFAVGHGYGIAAQSDGKFVIVGEYKRNITIQRFNSNGTLDAGFGSNLGTLEGRATSVAIQTDGKIVVRAGINLIRLNSDGMRDIGFGNNGFARTDYGFGQYLLIQPDGKLLVGGLSSSSAGSTFAMARHLGGASVAPKTEFDYDGDGKSDVSVFRPSENRWYILKSSDLSVIQPFFGAAGDIPAPADYDGDRKTDIAVFRPSSGQWWYISSANGAQLATQWGQNGDIPLPSDFDGDGKTDFIVYRPSNSTWYRLSATGTISNAAFGAAGDKPVIGDFDGDGKSDPAVYRPSTGVWWYASSRQSGVGYAVQFGNSTDIPVPANFDGDGKTDFAVYRPSDGGWHILQSLNGAYVAFPFGASGDKPVVTDYDGDGKADAGVFRPSNGSWYLLRSTSGFSGVQWGASTDVPTQNSFIQ